MRRYLRHFAWWLFEVLPLGPLAPYVFGLLIGRWPHRVE